MHRVCGQIVESLFTDALMRFLDSLVFSPAALCQAPLRQQGMGSVEKDTTDDAKKWQQV